jgi:diguanylate cyclase (GGDEF)-like protein
MLPRLLRLLQYSHWLALAILLAVVAALSLFYRGMVFESLVESETRSNVALTKTFANVIWPLHGDFIAGAGNMAPRELAEAEEQQLIKDTLHELSRGLGVVKVKIYDLKGLTAFSSDPRQVGEDKATNPGFLRARAGATASEITYRDRFDAWEGTLSDRNIISTYVPVRIEEGAPVEAVFEVYSDVTNLVHRMERSQWQILAGVLGAMAVVYLAVQLWLARYRRLLREQELQRHAHEEQIRYQAYHDALTGLPNRASFVEQLDAAMRRAKRGQRPLGLLFIDLDQFKRVNDSLGHDAGDRLLCLVAKRIRSSIREADVLFRMGGDEFTVLLEDARSAEEMALVAQRTIDAISEPVQLQHHELSVSASIGIAIYPQDEAAGERLLKSADTAMYRAKELGRRRYAFFAREMNERVENQVAMEGALRQALKAEGFVLHYQPRVSALTGRTVGAEALIRWPHREWGLVEPARFVPLLEETGLIVPVGAWVLREACRQAKAWQDGGLSGLRISVNLSSRQFQSEALADTVAEALRASRLEPGCLELELTESLLVENVEHAMEAMGRLKAIGVCISIDDFGTGYSSLGYLKRFPIDCLKIDRSFVRDLDTSPKDAAIVDAIAALAGSLGIGLVAEGVEQPGQADYLRNRHCTELQGFLFSKPVPAATLEQTLLQHSLRRIA